MLAERMQSYNHFKGLPPPFLRDDPRFHDLLRRKNVEP